MDPEEWDKHWLEVLKTRARIDAIYKWKIALIDKTRRRSLFFLTGYVVLIFAGIIFTNYAVMIVGFLCALAVIALTAWMGYQLRSNPYPGQDDG